MWKTVQAHDSIWKKLFFIFLGKLLKEIFSKIFFKAF